MKVAKIIPMAVMVVCPHCQEVVSEPNSGSQMWELQDINETRPCDCDNCGRKFAFPIKVAKLRRQI